MISVSKVNGLQSQNLPTGRTQKHLFRLAQHFFLMGAKGVQRAGFGQQRKF